MQIDFSRWVERDLDKIATYIAKHNPSRAVSFVLELRREIARIGDGPLRYQLRPEIAPEMRIAVYGEYIILFRVVRQRVLIERVMHGARDLPVQTRRRF